MAIFKQLSSDDVKTTRSSLEQLVDVVQEDISGSTTRKKYQVFVTGGVGPGVTSSLFQTVFDQDFTLQTANAVMDITVGLHATSTCVTAANPTIDSNGKYLFPSSSVMMREKMDIYRQFAQGLLGNASSQFSFTSGSTTNTINEALFLCFKRLFYRDQMKRETFAMQMFVTAATERANNMQVIAASGAIYTDLSAAVNKDYSYGGQVSAIVDSSNTNRQVGLLYIDRGIAVFDLSRILDNAQRSTYQLLGTLRAMSTGGTTPFTGSINGLLVSASIDDIVDHIASTRFSGSTNTAITFQNITNINTTNFYCRLASDEFNYSSNPTYVDANNRIVVIDEGQEDVQSSFTFVTSIGFYDVHDNLLAVGKVSRPILKDSERDLTLRVKLDF